MEPNRAAPADAPPWKAAWTSWPGKRLPLLLLASPGLPYRAGGGFTAEQADAWFCAASLRMADWRGGATVIPALSTVTVHLRGGALSLTAAGRAWLTPSTPTAAPGDLAAPAGRTLLGVLFTGGRPDPGPPSFHEFFLALSAGDALIGEVPVTTAEDREP